MIRRAAKKPKTMKEVYGKRVLNKLNRMRGQKKEFEEELRYQRYNRIINIRNQLKSSRKLIFKEEFERWRKKEIEKLEKDRVKYVDRIRRGHESTRMGGVDRLFDRMLDHPLNTFFGGMDYLSKQPYRNIEADKKDKEYQKEINKLPCQILPTRIKVKKNVTIQQNL